MRRARQSLLCGLGLAVLLAVGCGGGSDAVTGPDETLPAAGSAVIQGSVVGAGFVASTADVSALSTGSGMTVSVEGTALSTAVDEEGEFILARVPAGSVTLLFDGSGVNARVTVSGLLDGQVMTLEVHVSGGDARVAGPAHCTPTAETKIIGTLDAIDGDQLVVGGHRVDASQIKKIWRGGRGIGLEHLVLGEKVKVWGTVDGNGVIVAEEIQALSEGSKTWVTLEGTVTAVAFSALDVHANPNGGSGSCASVAAGTVHANPNNGSCPVLWVDHEKVVTDGGTAFRTGSGDKLDPATIAVGQHAYVEGWRKAGGDLIATTVKIG